MKSKNRKSNRITAHCGIAKWTLGLALLMGFATLTSMYSVLPDKLVSKNIHVKFYSHTTVEDIVANNYKAIGTLEPQTGKVVFSVPMQSFEFKKALMQKHFNSGKFLDTKTYPKAKFNGMITNLSEIDFTTNGTYTAVAKGELSIRDVTRPVEETGSLVIEQGKVTLKVKINIVLADYGIAFAKGKPSTNIAKEVETTINAIYDISPESAN